MIILYKSNEVEFSHNGLGALNAHIYNQEVEEVKNGLYSLNFKYSLFSPLGLELKNERIVKASTPDGPQLFRIYKVMPAMGELTVYAFHIFYDLAYNFISDANVVNKNGQASASHILSRTQYTHNFEIYSNIDNVANARIVRMNPIEALIDDSRDNSFVNRWGGEIKRDNFKITLNEFRGRDDGVTIRHKKNLSGYEGEIDTLSVATRIRPVGFDGLALPEEFVDSPLIGNYEFPRIKEIEYSHIKAAIGDYANDDDAVPLEEAYEALRQAASQEFTINELDIPHANYKINFIALQDTKEYKDFKALEEIGPWDFINVVHEEDGIEIKARMISYKFDPLNERYIYIELGNFSGGLMSYTNDKVNTLNTQIESIKDKVNAVQVSADGKTMVFRGPDEPKSRSEGDLWYKYNEDGTVDLYVFEGGEWVEFLSDITGKIITEKVDDSLKEATKAVEKANEAFQQVGAISKKADDAFTAADKALTVADAATGKITEVKVIAEGVQTLVTDPESGLQTKVTQLSNQWTTFIKDDINDKVTSIIADSNVIDLRIKKELEDGGSISSFFNLTLDGVVIKGEQIILDGDTKVLGSFIVESANIKTLEATKIKGGSLDFAEIQTINFTAENIVGGAIRGVTFITQSGASYIELNQGRMRIFDSDGSLAAGLTQNRLEIYNRFTGDVVGQFGRLHAIGDETEVLGVHMGGRIGYEARITSQYSSGELRYNTRIAVPGGAQETKIWYPILQTALQMNGNNINNDTNMTFTGVGDVIFNADKTVAVRTFRTTGYSSNYSVRVIALTVADEPGLAIQAINESGDGNCGIHFGIYGNIRRQLLGSWQKF